MELVGQLHQHQYQLKEAKVLEEVQQLMHMLQLAEMQVFLIQQKYLLMQELEQPLLQQVKELRRINYGT